MGDSGETTTVGKTSIYERIFPDLNQQTDGDGDHELLGTETGNIFVLPKKYHLGMSHNSACL